jgi:hypothetical protein
MPKCVILLTKKTMTRACVHVTHHGYPVVLGECRNTIETKQQLLREEFQLRPNASPSSIAMSISKA